MVEDEKLAIDEAQRAARHEAVKNTVHNEVQTEIAEQVGSLDANDQARAARIGEQFKDKAFREVVETESQVEAARGIARVSQFVDYFFYLVYGVIGLEIFLELMGARESNGFKQFIDAVSRPVLAPFETLMPSLASGQFQLKLSYIMALIVYIFVHLAINGLLRVMAHRKTEV